MEDSGVKSVAALRWRILRRSLVSGSGGSDDEELSKVSRVPSGSFGFFKVQCLEDKSDEPLWEYSLAEKCPPLQLRHARTSRFMLNDYSSNRQRGVDNTGVICLWPAEEVLAYYCLSHPDLFRNKRVLELGAGYGLAGLALAAGTEAAEVLVTDGNPKVVEYIEKNIGLNKELFGKTKVHASVIYWSTENSPPFEAGFDVIVAADCTYFRDVHSGLVHTIKSMLNAAGDSRALLLCPTRGRSLGEFVDAAKAAGLKVSIRETYDDAVWKLHNDFLRKDNGRWPNYDKEHNYPLLLTCTI